MATSSLTYVFFCLFTIVSSSVAQTSPRPLLKVTKDAKTLQYVTQIHQRTPLVPVNLTLDLGGPFVWVSCWKRVPNTVAIPSFNSSTYTPALCGSTPCRLLNDPSWCYKFSDCQPEYPGCYNKACQQMVFTSVAFMADAGDLGADVFKIQSTNGKNLTVPRLYFLCGTPRTSEGLASGVTGMAGLGWNKASLPTQLSSYFKFDNKFGLCLSSSKRASGAVFFGDGPYTLLPNIDAASSLTYTPLIVNPVRGPEFSVGNASPRYFIGVKSIKVNGKKVKGFNEDLFSFDSEGNGGTTISTVDAYTVLESSIYKAVVAAFVKAMPKNVTRVPNVAPFDTCFSSKNISSNRLGPVVPSIDLELQSKNAWRIQGANSMVKVKKNVLCLGFIDAGRYNRTIAPVMIGGHQIEDNLLQLDLSKSRLGFSSSLLGRSTSCAKYKYPSSA